MIDVFEITVDDPNPDEDGLARGRICIGDFRERFAIDLGEWPVSRYQAQWKAALLSLLGGTSAVALMSANQFAWIVYLEGDRVYVQQAVFVPGTRWKVDKNGNLLDYEPRTTTSDDGHPVSEWLTSIGAIKAFLSSDSHMRDCEPQADAAASVGR